MSEWKLTTRRGDEPRAYDLKLKNLSITVHRWVGDNVSWYVTVYGGLNIDAKVLKSIDVEDAKNEAIQFIRDTLESMLDALPCDSL